MVKNAEKRIILRQGSLREISPLRTHATERTKNEIVVNTHFHSILRRSRNCSRCACDRYLRASIWLEFIIHSSCREIELMGRQRQAQISSSLLQTGRPNFPAFYKNPNYQLVQGLKAMHSISILAPRARPPIWKVARAGQGALKNSA